ncbi:MAG: DUF6370 family protein [Verrucomicrobiota bacterium]
MKRKLIAGLAAAGLLLGLNRAALAESGQKEITIKGEGKCAKCVLGESKTCQNVVQVEKNGKTTTYYLAQNDVSKKFHSNICKESRQVVATGVCKKVDGKLEVTASKVELSK